MSTRARHRAPTTRWRADPRRTRSARQVTFAALFIAGILAWAVHIGLEAGALFTTPADGPGGGWLFTAAAAFTAAEITGRPATRDTFAAGWLAGFAALIATLATWARG